MHESEPALGYERERRRSRALLVTAIAACVVLLTGVIPSPYVIERPGPTVDVLGSVALEGEEPRPVIEIDGAAREAEHASGADGADASGQGSLRLLTVSISGSRERPKSWLSLLPGLVDPAQEIKPVDELYPEGVSEKARTEQNMVLMENSQEQAAASAFAYLGEDVPVTLTVAGIAEGSPAEGVLEEGDVLVEVAGESDFDFAQLREKIVANGADRPLALAVERDGARVDVELVPGVPDGGGEPMIGAVLQSEYSLPHEVDIALADIGGPSAGLVFALGIIDLMSAEAPLAGIDAAGTGTIDAAGNVGPIGGLEQKMWAASRAGSSLFLMPVGNCVDLPERIPGELEVVPVATLEEAVAAVETVADGGTPPDVEACSAP